MNSTAPFTVHYNSSDVRINTEMSVPGRLEVFALVDSHAERRNEHVQITHVWLGKLSHWHSYGISSGTAVMGWRPNSYSTSWAA